MGGGAGGPSGKGDSGLPDVAEPQSQILAFQVEKHLTWEKFLAWTQPDSMKKTQVSVFLPKFKLGKTYNMRPVLSGHLMVFLTFFNLSLNFAIRSS